MVKEPKTITVTDGTNSIVFDVSEVAGRFREDNDEKPDIDDIMDMIITEADEHFETWKPGGLREFTDEDGNTYHYP